MLPDFEMIIHKFPERKDITIIPIADVHLGARECMEQEFMAFIGNVAERDDTYLILGGDLLDNGLRNSLTNVYRATMMPSAQKKMMAKLLEPVRDKILCSVSGNHEKRSSRDSDDDPNYDIMAKLDLEHLHRESMAFLKLQFGDAEADGRRNPTYTLAVTHGHGGGMMTSGAVLRGERTAYAIDGADCLIFGHTHKPFVSAHGKLSIDTHNNIVSIKPFKVLCMTSWLDYTSYAMDKMLLPTAHAIQTITLSGDHKEMTITM